MKYKNIIMMTVGLSMLTFAVNAQTNIKNDSSTNNNTANSSSNTQSSSDASNGGLQNQQNFITNNPGNINYSGSYDVHNVPTVALGAFGNSFSSDYCSGTMQAALGVAGAGLALGKQKLDKGCQLLRAADMTMRIATVYAADASNAWGFAKTVSTTDPVLSKQIRNLSFVKAEDADSLKQGAVNMICAISDEVRDALVNAAVQCPASK